MTSSDKTLSFADSDGASNRRVVAPYLVCALNCTDLGASLGRYSILEVDRVTVGRSTSSVRARATSAGVATLDIGCADSWMSSHHAELERKGSSWLVRDCGSKNGTYVNGDKVAVRELSDGDLLEIGSTFFVFRDQVSRGLMDAADFELAGSPRTAFATLNPELGSAFATARKLAQSKLSLLITGETGSGKEVTARQLHLASGRKGDFVAVNCGAIPKALAEGELFGHARGAFSGAVGARPGLVRSAHEGTLFLDEVGELAPEVQVKLLRVLETAEVTPLGSERPVPVDLRVIAATHRDLPRMVDAGEFRQDLLARLCGAEIALPALRDRPEDLGYLAVAILADEGADLKSMTMSRSVARSLFLFDWPSNVRQLVHALRRALQLVDGTELCPEHLPSEISLAPSDTSDQALRQQLLHLLQQHQGNVSAVARELGKARVQVRRWCSRFGIDIGSFRR